MKRENEKDIISRVLKQSGLKDDMTGFEWCAQGRKRIDSDKVEERNNDIGKDSMILNRKERQKRTNAMVTEG